MVDAVSRQAREAVAMTALGLAGGLLLIVGMAFLTVALWIFLAAAESALIAALVIGLLYVGLGLILFAVASARRRRAERRAALAAAQTPKSSPLMQVAEGFAIGMQAGRAARSRPK
ncbi:phage holin family protein [Roseovarius spongiae]|nr:phage holin family protein [Roseovarius spongiae]